jgi:UPF0716 family protein affecting phage T7 exclusion
MSKRPEADHWLARPRNIRRLWIAFLAILALTVLAELGLERHPHFEFETLFGFGAWYGFLACMVLVFFSKALGAILKRPDGYYDD